MIKRITTLVFVFLTIVGNAVWGQTGNWIDNASTDWMVTEALRNLLLVQQNN